MTGIEYLEGFPEEIKEQIITEYGSLIDLYQMIFELNSQQYKLYQVKPLEKQKIFAIRNKLFDIEDKLEEFGIEDGRDVTTEVSSDFGEFMTNRQINALNNYLKTRGTDYVTMRQWLKDNYGI